jgi:TolB-like protein
MPESMADPASGKKTSRLWIGVLAMMIIPGIASLLYLRSAPRKPLDSVAVLAFVHAPDEPSFKLLGEKITETLHMRLRQVSFLRVAASEAVAAYSSEAKSAQAVGHELGVRALVRGRIERIDDGLLISVELVDSGDNQVLWSRQYQANPEKDAAAVSKEIAGQLVRYFSSR